MHSSCSSKCTTAGLVTRPQAVKYPDSTVDNATKGISGAINRRASTVRPSPTQRKPMRSAFQNSSKPAPQPNTSACTTQREITATAPRVLPRPSSSDTKRVVPNRIPLMAKVMVKLPTDKIS